MIIINCLNTPSCTKFSEWALRLGDVNCKIGDLIFSVINFARYIGADPEESLEKTNLKFIKRFNSMEKKILQSGKEINDMTLLEMDEFWELSKKDERR